MVAFAGSHPGGYVGRMGLFSRKSKDPAPSASAGSGTGETMPLEIFEGRPVAAALTDVERDRITAGLQRVEEQGVDVDDLESIGAGLDAARQRSLTDPADPGAEGPDMIVETFGIAIGEYLARHSARDWAVVTDVFGTDLGLVSARADSVIVPQNLIGVRWMRGEIGWVPGVIGHLARIAPLD